MENSFVRGEKHMKHKWHDEICAWAAGKKIEHRWIGDMDWQEVKNPVWTSCDLDFRIKPTPQEPQYLYAWVCKENDSVYLFYDKPSGVLEDEVHKYIGKIKLEVDDAV